MKRRTWLSAVVAVLTMTMTACSNSGATGQSSSSSSPSAAASAADTSPGPAPQMDFAYLENLGWRPVEGELPDFQCRDSSYADAVENGIKLGLNWARPYRYEDKDSGGRAGIDWDINMAALKFMGIEKYEVVEFSAFADLIPALQSDRIDVIAANIHVNAERLKSIGFTGPAWWYGSVMVVPTDNPAEIQGWKDLSDGKVEVGALNGSQTQAYLEKVGAKVSLYKDALAMFTAMRGGRIQVMVVDSPLAGDYIKTNADANMKILTADDVTPDELLDNYARYGVRLDDCTLNAAYSRALMELRDHGVIARILEEYGLDGRALYEPQHLPSFGS